jgi:RNA polymerase sigma factor (TIGR02999 family)
MATPGEVTQLLSALRAGDRGALERLFPLVYDELRRLARRQLRGRLPGQTLDTTALVHEAYLKLADPQAAEWQDRAHFLGVAATAMRHILVDAARRRGALKRGGDRQRVELDEEKLGLEARVAEIVEVDRALTDLSALSERLGRLVELRFFGGLSVEETAEVLQVSPRTIKREWRKARAFLYQALAGGSPA